MCVTIVYGCLGLSAPLGSPWRGPPRGPPGGRNAAGTPGRAQAHWQGRIQNLFLAAEVLKVLQQIILFSL